MRAVVKLAADVTGMNYLETMQDLIPEDLGGPSDWHVTITAGPVPGSFELEYPPQYENHRFIPTLLTKEEHYTANPPTLEYLQALLKLIVEEASSEGDFLGEISHDNPPIVEHLIPHACGGALDWNVQQML